MKPTLHLLLAVAASADTVLLKDGRQISGQIESGATREIQIKVGANSQTLSIDLIQSIQFDALPSAPPVAAPPVPQIVTLPVGAKIAVRTIDEINSKTADQYREYAASLDAPVVVDGVTVLPAQTKAFFRATDIVQPSFRKRASLSLSLVAVMVSGQKVAVETSKLDSQNSSAGRTSAKATLIAGAVGAVIGVMAGGGHGAIIGATLGVATGLIVSRVFGQGLDIPSETRLTYQLSQPAVLRLAAAPLATPPVLRSANALAVLAPTVSTVAAAEPATVGVVYLQDEAGKLIELERAKARQKYFPRTFGEPQQRWAVKGSTSSVQSHSGRKALFIVRLENGIDPASFGLLPMDSKKGFRWIKPGPMNQPMTVPFNVTRLGETSFGLTPTADLLAGEYAFVRKSLGDLYCFSVAEEGETK
jgi:hypothetical protein